ncbi:SRPBCC family protein [Bdellovibrio sp. HCB337]|uniref:SRPBCC family protein n=1 Tax=Bdellovibrio sp. HCB337 TaxID=3394358 RepID=UPI0039A73A78
MTYQAKHISVSIQRPSQEVYEFTSNPENLHMWAAGLSDAKVTKSDDTWVAESPMGIVRIKFADRNRFGVMDHDVTLPNGETNHNPFRVIKNSDGSEVMFTLYRLPRMSDEDFKNDANQIMADLAKLKSILER